jgi:RHH-type proline utilization regulon transcriptional repressor/proline dehydrogenase/delta 1-pyrroline-5-carboxylate dehydrogenase
MLRASAILDGSCLHDTAAGFFPTISEHYAVDEDAWLGELSQLADPGAAGIAAIRAQARELVERVRRRADHADTLDALLREYRLDTREGLMLMCLAEALLRVPDAASADALIRDRLSAAQWEAHLGHSDNLLVNFAAWGLVLTGRLVNPPPGDGRPAGVLRHLLQRSGEPVVRAALQRAMKLMGAQFVLGRDIGEALRHARAHRERGYSYSFDMLGEAALSAADAAKYRADYRQAIDALGREAQIGSAPRPSISIKLSALHPRYEAAQRERVLVELCAGVRELALLARARDVGISIDAEEADRLELSLELFERLLRDPELHGWGGLGLVVQAYSRRALPVLVWLTLLGRELDVRIPLRLVKGAYWDSEIKLAQQRGLAGYPVFTRKAGTDAAYLACARYLLSEHTRGVLLPQFATHNAHTVASILALAHGGGAPREFEFQRLHGMGEALYDTLREQYATPVRIYAPVGAHRELLPYLVRRLLENGANSSFVHRLVDPRVPVEALLEHPLERLRRHSGYANPRLPAPAQLFGAARRNSAGLNLNVASDWLPLQAALAAQLERQWQAAPLLGGRRLDGVLREVRSPAQRERLVGHVRQADAAQVGLAMTALAAAFPAWNATPVAQRAAVFERLADLLEARRAELLALCCLEAGKTLQDGLDEVREAVDYCRYYAQQAREQFGRRELAGPTGERNELFFAGRGVFACVSPWNFPLAIFLGQIAAALLAGNTVLAKPAEQGSLIAMRAVELLLEAGLPADALALLPGDGASLGAAFCSDARLAGVCFTGSTDTARAISRRLADKPGALAVLIAETGGQNAMIADSTALPEQVVKDAVQSAFTSAGQRCSALRVLCVQEDIAPRVIELLAGAMAELRVGLPQCRDTDVGPLIDAAAHAALRAHAERLRAAGRLLAETPLPAGLDGHFLAPAAFAIDSIAALEREHFGPLLHVRRYPADGLEALLAEIAATGYGLTLGVHSRNEATVRRIEALARVGNLYVNRNQIGAVVGVQPFGGLGLSGTGPKAGGPHYLARFAVERCTTTNTAAVGGNAALLALGDD